MDTKENVYETRVLTIPNALSFLRIALLPVIVWLYCVKKEYAWTTAVLAASELTDMLDGFIARRFHMISNLGKVLDPVADKLTQGVLLLCLLSRFPSMLFPLCLFILKEILNVVLGILVIKKTGEVHGADMHGKIATCLLYGTVLLHVLWPDIPPAASQASIVLCIISMVVSIVLYARKHYKTLTAKP